MPSTSPDNEVVPGSLSAPAPRRRSALSNDNANNRLFLQVEVLGAARFQIGPEFIDIRAHNAFALLLRLVFSAGMAVPRQSLVDELWADQPPVRRRANLRQALYKLRSIGIDVAGRGELIRLNAAQVAPSFSVRREADLFERDVLNHGKPFGVFLPGYTGPQGSNFGQWVEDTRSTIHSDVRRVLVQVLRRERERASWTRVERIARDLLLFDPLNEDATLSLAECAMLSGAKAEAVAILDGYLAELGDDAGEIRLPAQLLRKRFTEQRKKKLRTDADTDRHFVGREQELASLTMFMREARWNEGHTALVHGPPGIGKSRLITQLAKVAQMDGFAELFIDCRETEKTRPLAALTGALNQLLASHGILGALPEHLALVRSLASEQSEGSIQVRPLPRTARSVRDAITDVLVAASDEKPVLLIVEDAHWMDNESWDVIAHISTRIDSQRVFLAITSRERAIPAHVSNRISQHLKFVALPALSAGECSALAHAISTDYAASMGEHTEDWIVRASEGNPLALRLLINHWLENGETGVPPTLLRLVEGRIDRLHPHALRVMQTICLLNRMASVERVRRVLELPAHELMTAFEELEEHECLSRSEARLVAAHELLSRACLGRLQGLVRSTLHGSIGAVLSGEYLRTPSNELLIEMLHHKAASGNHDDAVTAVLQHQSDLLEMGSPQAALQILDQLDLSLAAEDERQRLDTLGTRLKVEAGEYGEAFSAIADNITIPSNLEELTSEEADILLSLADSAYRADADMDPDEIAHMCQGIAQSAGICDDVRFRAAEIGLTIAANTCDREVAESCFGVTESMNHRHGEHAARYQRLSLLYHTIFGDLDIAEATARSILKQNENAKASSTLAQDIGRAAHSLAITGDLAEAELAFKQAYEMALSIRAPKLALFPAWQLSRILLDAGDIVRSVHWSEQLITLIAGEEGTIVPDYIAAHFCRMAIDRNDLEAAQRYFHDLILALPKKPTYRSQAHTTALKVSIQLLSTGEAVDSASIDVLRQLHLRICALGGSDFVTATIIGALLRSECQSQAVEFANEYLSQARRERAPVSAPLAKALESLSKPYSMLQPYRVPAS